MIKKLPPDYGRSAVKGGNEYSTQMPTFFPLTQFIDSAKNSIFG